MTPPKLVLRVPREGGTARCARSSCGAPIAPIRFWRDELDLFIYEPGYKSDPIDYLRESRAEPHPGYGPVLALRVGWKRDLEGRWHFPPGPARRLERGQPPLRGPLPLQRGEQGIDDLRNAAWAVGRGDVVICPKCSAPMRVGPDATTVTDNYLIRLTGT